MKIAHISDIHVRNYKYHYEYRKVFQQLFDKLEEIKPDIIVNTGDTAHTKCNLSPEYFNLTSWLFTSLAKIAPLHMILGNHDCNVKNSSRLDAITPITEALEDPNIHFHKYTKEVDLGEGIILNVLSILDQDKWTPPSDPDKTNIALYHGAVAGSKTDTGWVMEHGEIDLEFLENFDYGFLGDIHRTNQIVDDHGKARYPGSLIQQNFGESLNKGFLLWDVKDKENYTCDFYELKNPKPFVTINLTPKGRIPKSAKPPEGARLRLVSSDNQSIEIFRKAVDIAKKRFKPESISFLNRAHGGERISVEKEVDCVIHENLRDQSVQEKLIAEYLKEYNVNEETLNEVYSLNGKYNTLAESNEETTRNVSWKIKNFKWNNLFNYGENNELDFTKLSGTVGIFGKNYSGKSSVIDSLLYAIYNNTSKNIRKNYNIINEHKDQGSAVVEIEAGNKTYTISRESNKYVKKLKGAVTNEAKTDVEFVCTDNVMNRTYNLNSTERHGTDRNIKKMLGTLEDFLLTSMSSQLGSMQFINEGSTRRKEILAKFLDLEFFEKKFKLAKEEVSELRGVLKRIKDIDYDEDMKKVKEEIFEAGADVAKKKNECAGLKIELGALQQEITELEAALFDLPDEIIHIKEVRQQLLDQQVREDELVKKIEDTLQQIEEKEIFLQKSEKLLSALGIVNLNSESDRADEIEKEIVKLTQKKGHSEKDLSNFNRQTNILNEVPCGNQFITTCKFIKDANSAKKQVEIAEKVVEDLKERLSLKATELEKLDLFKIRSRIENFNRLTDKRKDEESLLMNLKFQHERMSGNLVKSTSLIQNLWKKIRYYEENRELLENTEKLYSELATKKNEVEERQKKIDECDECLYSLIGSHGALEQKLENLQHLKTEQDRLSAEYSAHHLFLTCMHSNGIAFDIINKALPVLNEEISKVLANIVNFEVYFEKDGNKLDIFIHHPKHEPRPLENGSGAEKTLAAVAIRIALLNISNMPKCNLIILDEPGAALDEEHLESFTRILEMLKSYFDIVILITHIESLKDTVDMTIDIMKTDDGYAYVNQ